AKTRDILTDGLQVGGRTASALRLVLAATLGASYGIYGPAFELAEVTPLTPGREEYLNSEKYQIRHWDLERPGSLRPLIAKVNRIRREHPALQQDWTLRFLRTDNERLLAFAKTSPLPAGTREEGAGGPGVDVVVVVVNLDPTWAQSGWVEVPVV